MTRGKWVAALAAVATLTACVVAPAAQADGTDDPNAAVSEAKAAYDRAVSDRDALKPARDKAQATLDEGTVGYFRARGADDAVRILTDPTVTKYAAEIGRDRKNTATSLDSMVKSLSYVREINGLRTGDNSALKPLDVSDSLMAVAEAHWDHFLAHEDDGPQHWGDFNIGENIGCWSEGFYQEKALYEQTHEDSSRTGHYLNIVKPSYVVTGWAEAYQEFDSDSQWLDPDWLGYAGDSLHQGRVMSVDDYEADVNAYKAPLDKAVSDYDDAAKAADDAKSAYDRAKAAADAWNNAMFTVSFDTAGGSDVKAQTVRRGGTVSKPTDPTRAGYLFGGWYKGDAEYDFSTPVSADLTLSAHWRADPSAKVFTVSFDPGNGQMISDRSVRAGQAISEPKAPTRSGYVFDGWYTIKSGGSKYDFSTPVTADLNLYAHWTAEAPAFRDVDASTPHAADIEWTAAVGVSKGWLETDGSRTFRGMDTVKRQDMAAFLRRLAVRMGVNGADSWKPSAADWKAFSDVDASTPHAEDVLWLAHAGIATGYRNSDGSWRFEGMTPVYRQDMAAFLHRLARLAGRGGDVAPKGFRDVTDTTPHAEDVRWLGGSGVAKGYVGGVFGGMTPTYRQDMAAFLHRTDGLD